MILQQNSNVNIWGWTEPGKSITITPSWTNQIFKTKADDSGKWISVLFTNDGDFTRHSITITDGSQTIRLQNILLGEVWLCSGQSNMEMPMKGYKNQPVSGGNEAILKSKNSSIRLFTVKRNSQLTLQDTVSGKWEEASPAIVKNFSATAYFFGKLLNEMLDVPVGLIVSSWGGSCIEAWMDPEMLSAFKNVNIPVKKEDIKEPNRTPTLLYNAMINPIAGYTIKGCIWYQGESNYEDPDKYPALFKAMVEGWRKKWNFSQFPFYYCQIAPFDYGSIAPKEKQGGKYNSAFLREAQLKASNLISNSGMVVLMDIGEQNCIHPANKKEGGERLAMMALAKTYGIEGFAFESPVYKEMEIKDGKAILSFDKAPMWLSSFGKELKCFEIAGEDRIFYPAKAEIKRSKIEVYASDVKNPVAVRYAFKDFIIGDLFSTEGLPVSSFRTDNWNK